jgi:hypothetical protein
VIVMSERFRPDPAEFERSVSHLCLKIETIALAGGVSHLDCSKLEELLAAIPLRARAEVLAMLNDVGLRAEYDDPAMAFAARYMTRLAQDIWRANPHP